MDATTFFFWSSVSGKRLHPLSSNLGGLGPRRAGRSLLTRRQEKTPSAEERREGA
jgi:hypothetical protein